MNKLIIDALKELDINVFYLRTTKRLDRYMVFSIYNESESDKADNISYSESYSISINYWYKNANDMALYKDIIKLLKNNGFIFDGCQDVVDSEYFGKNIDFIYNKRKEV